MINLDQLKQEVSDITHEFDRKVAMQVIDYLSEKGYLKEEWRPIETAPKTGEKILVYRPVHDGDYIPVTGEDYWGSTMFDPEGCWMRSRSDCQPTHWRPLPEPPKEKEND